MAGQSGLGLRPTPVPPPNWPSSPGGAGSPGPALGFALIFLPSRAQAGQSSSCASFLCPQTKKAIEKVYAIKAVAHSSQTFAPSWSRSSSCLQWAPVTQPPSPAQQLVLEFSRFIQDGIHGDGKMGSPTCRGVGTHTHTQDSLHPHEEGDGETLFLKNINVFILSSRPWDTQLASPWATGEGRGSQSTGGSEAGHRAPCCAW